ncbi:hypothetical protein IMZ48_44065 [Candidatus Bathyarchaeota archaeon]|nr:hypothetical protein [Candidatus Bathyarchaeota archaeon]
MNEPNRGMAGHPDLTVIPKDQPLKKGSSPTAWQCFLTGSGRACEVETWEIGGLGPYKVGTKLIDPQGELAWLPADYDDSRYGYKRDPGWKLGECIWAQHEVWDPATDTLLKKNYFAKNPRTGDTIDYPNFTNTYFMDFYRRFRDAIRAQHKDCLMLMQYPTLELPPQIAGTEDDDPKMAFTPHFYDGITLMTKKWNRTWNVDVVGVLRGKYYHPVFAIKVGETAIRNCFRDQLATLRQEGRDRVGKHPCLLTEFGIPYDMDDKRAYETGDYSSQSAALDANHYGVEGSLMEGSFLWLYMARNTHKRGDQWNGEDLSILSLDDKPLPMPAATRLEPRASTSTKGAGDDASVTPDNLRKVLTAPSISSEPGQNVEASGTPGYRAAEAFVRPTPVFVAGTITEYGFDLKSCTFTLKLDAKGVRNEAPTVVYLPEFHYPADDAEVEVSSGKWEIKADDGEGPAVQRLIWWHGEGAQSLRVRGLVRKRDVEGEGEDGYVDQCRETYSMSTVANNCSVM